MKLHNLKIQTEHFEAILAGRKTAELRINDRNYSVGDALCLHEFANGNYTCRKITRYISHVLEDETYLQKGYVMLSLAKDNKLILIQE
ncbi:hypothetical protein A9G36_03110 [Gilliamella sp. Choc6-1]|uniref:DUF3850 domain-containing protein n=1 Tax=Gilliamella sp. Choc6-1 TaxID=3120239 RepID=UPI00080D8E77|nr:DUF3850 domain-containing protein [Gilliamella apicola]OCG56334.1 hypothetical protein A9G36_03110 [Gilliamella apicola]